ncbi:MAG TPA: tetratricopeptide repeat protein [Pyrinomonadaceae bacterium]|nr:tetratricopeptide repeat protein [Pyrinomonadaceae bacterium]
MGFDKAKAIRAAEKSLAQGKIPAAIQEYRRIVENDPEDYSALNTLGDLHARVDQKADAVACYRRVAEHYRDQGFALKAIAMFKKVTRFVPGEHATALALARLYEQQGLVVDARAQYLAAADALARAGDTREALEVLRRIADLDPANTNIRLRLAESYVAEDMTDDAAEVYTEAGERLLARAEYEPALDCYKRALSYRPFAHAALQGLVAVHAALGTAGEAAQALEEAVKSRPGDTELRAMLARSYVESEEAEKAERIIEGIVRQEPSNYSLFFDVARLYLRQGEADAAARALGHVIDSALAGRQEEQFLELLQEVLARDPEQMEALHLLVRVHTWQRDDLRLRKALERLADAAETTGDEDEERRALAQLARLSPEEPRYLERLQVLGGGAYEEPPHEAEEPPAEESRTVPTFESFVLNDEAFNATTHAADGDDDAAPAAPPPVNDYEWATIPPPSEAAEADRPRDTGSVSFDFSDLQSVAPEPSAPSTGFQEIDFGAPAAPVESAPAETASAGERMLQHELEGVDFYLAQGYTDIARDTLDMLERQYGAHAEIESRRALVPAPDAQAPTLLNAPAPAAPPDAARNEFDFSDLAAELEAEVPVQPVAPAPGVSREEAPPPVSATTGAGGLDPGLAAVFDEFREAVEDADEDDTAVHADFETHYNMGLAYREMGLHDQAIEELQTAVDLTAPGDGTARYLNCCNMLGHCFMEKGMPRPAAMWFRKGTEAPGHTEDEYQALRYELGAAYEQLGDLQRAIEVFSEVYAIDVSYRGVAGKLRELEEAQKAGK